MVCPFCDRLAAGDLVAENGLAAAFLDAFPLSPGHRLAVPRRHEPDFLALTAEEQRARAGGAEARRARPPPGWLQHRRQCR